MPAKVKVTKFSVLKIQAKIDTGQAYRIFSQIFLVTHGIVSLLANHAMTYDEEYCIKVLSNAYFGAMHLLEGGNL